MHRTNTRRASPAGDTYMELVRRLPLKTIKNDEGHARAAAMVSELIGRDLDPGSADYLDALLVLVNNYEDEHHVINKKMRPREALLALMDFNKLTQADIGRIIGSESAVSIFLRGDRSLSKAQIKKLADWFKVAATLFLD